MPILYCVFVYDTRDTVFLTDYKDIVPQFDKHKRSVSQK